MTKMFAQGFHAISWILLLSHWMFSGVCHGCMCLLSRHGRNDTQRKDPMKFPAVNWNQSNPMFKTSNLNHIVEVGLNDLIDFECPYYPMFSDYIEPEYYVIYMVSRKEYEGCYVNLYEEPLAHFIVNCSKPWQSFPHRHTIQFTSFSAVPNAPQFEEGRDYYFTTQSTGRGNGIGNTDPELGACEKKNMKLTIRICCSSTTTTTSTTTRSTTTTRRYHPQHSTTTHHTQPIDDSWPSGPKPTIKPGEESKEKGGKSTSLSDENEIYPPHSSEQEYLSGSRTLSSHFGLVVCSVTLALALRSWWER